MVKLSVNSPTRYNVERLKLSTTTLELYPNCHLLLVASKNQVSTHHLPRPSKTQGQQPVEPRFEAMGHEMRISWIQLIPSLVEPRRSQISQQNSRQLKDAAVEIEMVQVSWILRCESALFATPVNENLALGK